MLRSHCPAALGVPRPSPEQRTDEESAEDYWSAVCVDIVNKSERTMLNSTHHHFAA